MFYIDGSTAYIWTPESDIMRLALMEKGKSLFYVRSGDLIVQAPFISKNFYVATGSTISEDDFGNWCARNRLRSALISESPLVNSTMNGNFRFYIVHRY